MGEVGEGRPCWSTFCIASFCDRLHHVDATGYAWEEERRGDWDCAECIFRMDEATRDEAETEHVQAYGPHAPAWSSPAWATKDSANGVS